MKRKILIIGDDWASQQRICQALPANEFEAFTISSQQSLVFYLCLIQPDLILVDMTQSGAYPGKLVRRIREWSWVPVIVLSALAEHRTKLESLIQGADDFMVKPFNNQELLAKTRALLRRVPVRMPSAQWISEMNC